MGFRFELNVGGGDEEEGTRIQGPDYNTCIVLYFLFFKEGIIVFLLIPIRFER